MHMYCNSFICVRLKKNIRKLKKIFRHTFKQALISQHRSSTEFSRTQKIMLGLNQYLCFPVIVVVCLVFRYQLLPNKHPRVSYFAKRRCLMQVRNGLSGDCFCTNKKVSNVLSRPIQAFWCVFLTKTLNYWSKSICFMKMLNKNIFLTKQKRGRAFIRKYLVDFNLKWHPSIFPPNLSHSRPYRTFNIRGLVYLLGILRYEL